MDQNEQSERQYGQPRQPTLGDKIKKLLAPIGAAFVVLFKYLKFALPVIKTGGSMILSIWVYAWAWGWKFAVGFVMLIFVHECGHLLAARRIGLKVGAPVCELIYLATGNLMFRGLAYTGFFLNLFNLAPIGFLDGGRIVTALSPWLWILGYAIMVPMLFLHFNFIVLLILGFSLPRLFSLFRPKSGAELRYFEVTPAQRWTMGALYFGLIALLVLGMAATHIAPEEIQVQ